AAHVSPWTVSAIPNSGRRRRPAVGSAWASAALFEGRGRAPYVSQGLTSSLFNTTCWGLQVNANGVVSSSPGLHRRCYPGSAPCVFLSEEPQRGSVATLSGLLRVCTRF